jgi:hypothetical protein
MKKDIAGGNGRELEGWETTEDFEGFLVTLWAPCNSLCVRLTSEF